MHTFQFSRETGDSGATHISWAGGAIAWAKICHRWGAADPLYALVSKKAARYWRGSLNVLRD